MGNGFLLAEGELQQTGKEIYAVLYLHVSLLALVVDRLVSFQRDQSRVVISQGFSAHGLVSFRGDGSTAADLGGGLVLL